MIEIKNIMINESNFLLRICNVCWDLMNNKKFWQLKQGKKQERKQIQSPQKPSLVFKTKILLALKKKFNRI
jgi:hypothetical protein